ncbi:TPA: hypothetical protein HA278_00165 [Candidatus Woesearchaeota archaeon]|nr:hypothetical protein [archaeon]HIJ10443.1 hypothetical protein [Candidatus Woesearchaeota archaeon]
MGVNQRILDMNLDERQREDLVAAIIAAGMHSGSETALSAPEHVTRLGDVTEAILEDPLAQEYNITPETVENVLATWQPDGMMTFAERLKLTESLGARDRQYQKEVAKLARRFVRTYLTKPARYIPRGDQKIHVPEFVVGEYTLSLDLTTGDQFAVVTKENSKHPLKVAFTSRYHRIRPNFHITETSWDDSEEFKGKIPSTGIKGKYHPHDTIYYPSFNAYGESPKWAVVAIQRIFSTGITKPCAYVESLLYDLFEKGSKNPTLDMLRQVPIVVQRAVQRRDEILTARVQRLSDYQV